MIICSFFVVQNGVRSLSAAERTEFVRNQYYGLEWRSGGEGEGEGTGEGEREGLGAGVLVTDTDIYCEVRLQRAGSFHYYFVYDTP